MQWLLDQRLVQRLVEMIDPSQSSEVIPILHKWSLCWFMKLAAK